MPLFAAGATLNSIWSLEILELLIGQKLRAVTQAHQVCILDAPRDCGLGITQAPAGEVAAVEQGNGLTPDGCRGANQRGRAFAAQLPH